MAIQRQAIFREKALKHYTQGRKKDVLPRFHSLSAGLFGWLLLASLIATGLVAWYGQVPVYLAGSGLVLDNGSQVGSSGQGAMQALAFFAPEQATHLRAGAPVQAQFAASSAPINGLVMQVLPGTTNLAAALEHYGLNVGSASLQSQQVVVALINLKTAAQAEVYAGSTVMVEVKVGTQSLFSALTGLGLA